MKRTSKQKLIALITMIGLAVAVLTSCGNPTGRGTGTDQSDGNQNTSDTDDTINGNESEDNSSGSGYQTTFGDKQFDDVTISAMVFDRSNAPAGMTATDNNWTEYINEKMSEVGITVEFIAVPRSDELNKVNTMMATSTAADLMLTYNGPTVLDFYNKGGLYDLSEYINEENQARNLKEYVTEEVLDIGRLASGEMWSVPARRATTARTNINIRKDWLDDLGLDIPQTVDELHEALRLFKEENPEGRTDVIAASLQTGAGPVAHAFIEAVNDEKAYAIANVDAISGMWAYTDPGFVAYLRWLNELYNEGILDPEYYVHQDFGQTNKERFVNGQLGFLEYDVNGNVDSLRGGLLQNLKANNPDAEFVSIEPLKHTIYGEQYNPGYPINGAYVFVPKTADNPEAAITYLDWQATIDGGFTIFHGFEEEHFNFEDGVPVIIDAEHNANTKDWTRHDLFLIGNQGYYATPEDFNIATSKELPGWEQYVLDNYNNAAAGTVRNEPTFASPTMTEQSANLMATADVYIVRLITGSPESFDATFDEYWSEMEKYGMEQVLAERTEYYEAYYSD